MIQIPSTGSQPGSRRRTTTTRMIASLLLALAGLSIAAAPHAQDIASAIPEFITLTEADLQTPIGTELASAQEAFRESLTEDPERALEIAKQIVTLTAEFYGESHESVSQALTNLAIVQAENTNFGAAIENYGAAIRARERGSKSIVSPELINPLRGLAGAYMALNEIELAIPIYERAIHISHVNEGPNNLDQVELIDALSRAYFFQGELDTASDMQDAIFRLRQRRFDDNPDQYIDALVQRSAWYSRLGNWEEAVQAYRRLERTISKQYGAEDIRLIEPLVSLANAAIMIPEAGEPALNEGRRAIARAVRIARAHAEDDQERFARTLVDQGDWLSSLNQTRHSRLPYREAWNLLNDDPDLHNVRDELFAAPVPVVRVRFRSVYGQRVNESIDPERFPQRGFADVAFDVDPLGRPLNVRIVDGNPPGLMDGHLRRQIRRFRFRPAFSNGQPYTYTGLTYRHPFRYDESRFSNREREVIAKTSYEDVEPPISSGSSTAPARRSVSLDPDRVDPFVEDTISIPQSAPQTGDTELEEGDTDAAAPPEASETATDADAPLEPADTATDPATEGEADASDAADDDPSTDGGPTT